MLCVVVRDTETPTVPLTGMQSEAVPSEFRWLRLQLAETKTRNIDFITQPHTLPLNKCSTNAAFRGVELEYATEKAFSCSKIMCMCIALP